MDRLWRRAERAPALSPRQACGTRHLARVPEIKRWVGACADAPHQTSLASPHQTSLTSPHAGLSPGSAAGGTARARARSSRPGLSPSGRLGSCTYCINGRDTAWGFQVKLRCQTGVDTRVIAADPNKLSKDPKLNQKRVPRGYPRVTFFQKRHQGMYMYV